MQLNSMIKLLSMVSIGIVLTGCSSLGSHHPRGDYPYGHGAHPDGYYHFHRRPHHPAQPIAATRGAIIQSDFATLSKECVPPEGTEHSYFFAFDKSQVDSKYFDSISKAAQYLIQHPKTVVRLEGNADDRGSREYNVALSFHRAKSVKKQLLQYGVHNKFIIVPNGAEKPVLLGHSASAWECNRRVDVIYESHGR